MHGRHDCCPGDEKRHGYEARRDQRNFAAESELFQGLVHHTPLATAQARENVRQSHVVFERDRRLNVNFLCVEHDEVRIGTQQPPLVVNLATGKCPDANAEIEAVGVEVIEQPLSLGGIKAKVEYRARAHIRKRAEPDPP